MHYTRLGKAFFLGMAGLAVVMLSGAAHADSHAAAKAMYEENCLSCHGSEVYTREDRMVNSMPSLVTMVNRCNVNLNVGWFDDEVESVAQFLRENYYGF